MWPRRHSRRRCHTGGAACALLLLLCVAAAAEPVGDAPPALPSLTLAPAHPTLERRLTGWLEQAAPAQPMEEWAPGLTIAEQTGRRVAAFTDPIDTVLQYRVPSDFCPDYLPEMEPGRNTEQLCGPQLRANWQLEQGYGVNPFQVAQREADEIANSPRTRRHKLYTLAAYAWLHRDEEDLGVGAADLLLSDIRYARREVLLSALGPPAFRKAPQSLTQVSPGEGEMTIDLRVTPGFAFDSVATGEQMLQTAAQRGLGAVVIAGRGQLGDGQLAARLAERWKHEGRLPNDFRVVIGQYMASRTGDVVGLFLKSRLLDGQTMAETVHEIHSQGGLAYLARPGEIGAAASLVRLPFDGYLMQPGNFELFRTLLLLNDPRLADKPALYASNSTVAFSTGLPYSNVPLDMLAADPLQAGLASRHGYAASALYFPWMMALLTKPVAVYQKTLNRYFQLNDALAVATGRALGADNVLLRTSWDDEMRDLISLSQAWPALSDVWQGGSALRRFPRLNHIEAEFGKVSVGYDRLNHEWELSSRWRW